MVQLNAGVNDGDSEVGVAGEDVADRRGVAEEHERIEAEQANREDVAEAAATVLEHGNRPADPSERLRDGRGARSGRQPRHRVFRPTSAGSRVKSSCARPSGTRAAASAETVPSGGTSDYAPEMIHAAAEGKPDLMLRLAVSGGGCSGTTGST